MGDVINLQQYRKQLKRAEKEARAAANRTRHGRGKAERESRRAEQERSEKTLSDHRVAEPEPEKDPPAGA